LNISIFIVMRFFETLYFFETIYKKSVFLKKRFGNLNYMEYVNGAGSKKHLPVFFSGYRQSSFYLSTSFKTFGEL